jgi:methylenetetrahydrofolate reductase (NADPH)
MTEQAGPARQEGCPKRMVYGPCGGVRADLSCEMAPVPCPFARGGPVVFEPEATAGTTDLPPAADPGSTLTAAAARGPVVLADLSVRPFDPASIRQVTGALAGACDAVLVGEHQNTPDFPPAVMTSLIRDAGGTPWITLTCRDRNRLVLEQELAGLRQASADGVLCATGDGRAPGIRPGVTQVFDLDGTRLTAMAAAAGLCAAVPESPAAPPVDLRPARLAQKQRAGARLCVLNHVGAAAQVRVFAARARQAGVTVPLIAGVAVYTDEGSAGALSRFPGLELDLAAVRSVLGAASPVAAGIAAAVARARELLAVDGIAGVNLSGLASARGEVFAAGVKAQVGRELRDGS